MGRLAPGALALALVSLGRALGLLGGAGLLGRVGGEELAALLGEALELGGREHGGPVGLEAVEGELLGPALADLAGDRLGGVGSA